MKARESEKAPEQTPQEIGAAVEAFLAECPQAVVLEDGKVLFDMRLREVLTCDRARALLAAPVGRGTKPRPASSRGDSCSKDVLRLSTLPVRTDASRISLNWPRTKTAGRRRRARPRAFKYLCGGMEKLTRARVSRVGAGLRFALRWTLNAALGQLTRAAFSCTR